MGVDEQTATALALVVHELATNAVKYGALSVKNGTLDVSGSMEGADVRIVWTEHGGPEITAPRDLSGYGSGLARRTLGNQIKGSVSHDWSSSGVLVTMVISGERLSR